ncbi:hypothetical protein NEAUS04_1484 [Nematocida ausubeli]|uniref:Uncharacterized protein n=1 Tax=Nematocida ausubeli (strain ATCC PRA-371 / ERTm2) TaxID=1913371 RepID=H8ZBQ0_NEMA1|nr:uncharacterized protein NESG_01150 [Nematocida ausubeli]EHY66303.1 hypothetical protein NERG_00999 [Nematocida ausubeli]KAI5135215.1 hypothetical protein NEAUS06_1432 [Nematocida ausubeli]KAI5136013.1 hypothetical protein NEAUS07_1421 [Nematocida ausubeli]KAI5147847.1 hypothetical protein NEAUS05_1128 [Nematocida ausubeli]KAI5160924.1 hypothetical protein NEAUS03_1417 [Nematocida ausubeli]
MNYVIQDLECVRKAALSRTNSINTSKLTKKMKYDVLVQIIEDALSKVHCKYALDLTNAIVCNTPVNSEMHVELTKTLELFKKTKKEISKTIKRSKVDPITEEYISHVLRVLEYNVE